MADEKVGNKTGKTTQVGRDVYETSDGEMVSEKSTTFQYKGKWINVPTIHNGYQYDDDTLRMLLEEGIIEPTSIHEDEPSASKAARERSDNLKFSKGGTPMQRQMELFGDGGLKDEGGMIDEISGNEVPIGGTREGVRDDIPANVSEGEFIFPADVTRYLGLEKLMQLRQQAKMGLQEMDAMGQMGNSDEATMDDDLPFGMADIMVVSAGGEPMEFADGGFVPTKNYAPGGMGTTRSLSPEIIAPARTKIDFKQLMGEAAIEFKEYRNEEGKSIMVAHIGGVAAFPIPEGYTLYVADDSIGNGDTATDDIVADANNAVAEKALADEAYNAGYPSTATDPSSAIDWENLSTKELLEELPKITGVGSMIAKAAMLFLGPFGLAGYALIRKQEKRAAKATQANIAKGGLPSSELTALKEKVESLTTKSSVNLDKVLETVGGALGLTIEDIKETKKNAAQQVTGDLTGDFGPMSPVSTASMRGEVAKDGIEFDAIKDKQAKRYRDMLTHMATMATPLPLGQTREGIESSIIKSIGEDGFREIQAETRPDFMRINSVGNLDETGTILRPGGILGSYQEEKYGLSPPGSKLTSEESIAKRKDAASAYTPPSYNPVVTTPANVAPTFPVDPRLSISNTGLPAASVPAPVSTQEDFGASVPEARFTAPVAPALEPLEGYVAPSTKPLMSIKNVPEFIRRAGEESRSLIYDTPISELQAQELGYSTEQPVRSTIDVVPPSPVTGQDLRPSVPAPVTASNVAPTFPVDPRLSISSTGLPAASVAEQTDQAFPNLTRGFDDSFNIETSPSSVTPTAELTRGFDDGSNIATSLSSVTPTAELTRGFDDGSNIATSPSSVTTTTAPTFNEKFATERLAGAKTFSYDRDGDGTMESYTTETAEEASPKSSGSLYERIANFLTPGDDKEYKDGVLYNTKTNKPIGKKKITSAGASSQSKTQGSVDKETTASNAIDTLNSAIDKAQSLGSDADPKEYYDTMMAQSNASKAATKAIKERTAERKAKEANAYQGGLLTKPKSKKKTKATTKKRGLAARK